MRPDYFISRCVHTLSGALLFTACAAPFVFADVGALQNRMLPMYLTLAMVVSGLYNAGAARPSRMTTSSGAPACRVAAIIARPPPPSACPRPSQRARRQRVSRTV